MKLKELLEKRTALLNELRNPETTAERFAEIRAEVEKVNFLISEAQKDEDAEAARNAAQRDEELRAARNPAAKDGTVFDTSKAKNEEERANEAAELETRAQTLKEGKAISVKVDRRAAVASSQTALGVVASDEINPTFEQVSTLYKAVNEVHLEGSGAESYKKPFVKTIGEGGVTKEGADYTDAEPTFDYASINKVKITAYAEVNEEVEKLPAARYLDEINKAIVAAWYKKLNAQIVGGKGGSDEIVGLTAAPAAVIDKAKCEKTIATIDENTLDTLIFNYGGDEDVEGDATLVLNKLTLEEFAKVRGSDKKRVYNIVVRGNSGTINGVPFICTSKLAPFATVENGKPYLIYGKLKGYELAYFTDLDVQKSTDYKFKQGVIALRVSGFVGGSPAMYNGFMSVIKAAAD